MLGRITEAKKTVKLDAKDKKILALLAENSRSPASEIAKKVLLSRDTVAYRINRLQQEGIILSFFPIIDISAFGYSTYHVFLLLNERAKAHHDALLAFLQEHPATRTIMSYTDTWDIEWVLIAKDIKEFDAILTEVLTKFPEVVLEKEKLATITRYSSLLLPYSFYAGVLPTYDVRHAENEQKYDATDMKLLRELSKDCRQNSYELGRKMNLSPDAVVYRMKRLTSVIKRFTILANLTNLGYSWYTYVIRFTKFDAKDEAKFVEFATKHPAIIHAAKVFGKWDVLLYIVADSPQHYHLTVKEIKNTFSDIINSYQTWFAHEEYFYTPLPKVIGG